MKEVGKGMGTPLRLYNTRTRQKSHCKPARRASCTFMSAA